MSRIFSLILVLAAILGGAWTPGMAHGATFSIPRLDSITVDGATDDWKEEGFAVHLMTGLKGEVEEADDFAPAFRLGWNDAGLLIVVTVQDDILLEAGPNMRLWDGDSLELYLAAEQGKEELFEVVLSPGVSESQTELRSLNYGFNTARREAPEGLVLKQAKLDTGYAIEALLPWSAVGLDPKAGATAAFQIVVNDSDEAGQRFQSFWYPEARTFENTRRTHVLTLDSTASPAVLALAQGHYDAFARTALSVFSTGDKAGATLSANHAGSTHTATLRPDNGWARAELFYPMPAEDAEGTQAILTLDGAPLESIALPSADEQRARMLMGAAVRFDSYVFDSSAFPECDFENPLLAERLIGPYTVRTTFYDNEYNAVSSAAEPGRYGAVIEITPLQGTPITRMQTVFRAPFDLGGVQEWFLRPDIQAMFNARFGVDATVATEQSGPIGSYLGQQFMQDLHQDPQIAAMMASLFEGKSLGHEAVRADDPWSQDRQWWVKLKRILYFNDKKLDVPFVCPQHFVGDPAPTLREGTEAEAGMKPGVRDALDAIFTEWAEKSGEPFAVALARKGVVYMHAAYGERDGVPITVNEPMWMASITKFMSATLMMELVDQNLVDLDEKVATYLEPFRYVEVPRELTVRDLYVHTNGLQLNYTFPGYYPDHWGDELHDLEQVIAGYYPHMKIGQALGYNGVGYALGGKIMEAITGEALPVLFKNHLLDPLGMKHTDVGDASAKSLSTPMDIATWGQMMLNRGAYGAYRFMREESFEQMLPKPLRETIGFETDIEWGIGTTWMDDNGLSEKTFAHGAASSATFRIDPERELVIVMTRNTAGPLFDEYYPKFIQTVVANVAE
ncbi:MAG: serine hydrolase [Candidatus Hydrogenedentes bacterium]|nr:serine hydrolase [Candidatus Hydrogenedentota bacterium]